MSKARHIRPALLRFADRDAMGHVNSLRLAELVEDARLDFLAGMPQADHLEWRLASLQIDFRAQPDAALPLETRSEVARLGRSSFDMKHRIVQGGIDVLIATSVLVQVDPQEGRAVAMDAQQCEFLTFTT